MKTNNHPARGPVSLDRLHQISEILSKAAAQSDGGNLGYAMADAVKVIDGVLASEPVADVVAWSSPNEERTCDIRWRRFDVAPGPLYSAPPAPVVPDEMYWQDAPVEGSTRAAVYATGWNACRAAMLQGADGKPELTVWYGAMPETNGKTNWTAMLHRKGQHPWEGITIDCSEYPDRVRYEADRMRHLIGELADEPDILAYDADAHSGYVNPGNSPVTPDGWKLVPKEPTEAMNKAGWAAMNEHDAINPTYRAMLAAAPQQDVKSALEHGMQRYSGAMQKLSEGDD